VITSPIAGKSYLTIRGPEDKSAKITFTREVQAGDNLTAYANSASLFKFDDGTDNVELSHLVMEYTGTVPHDATGIVNGVHVGQVDNFYMHDCEVYGFSYAGVRVKHFTASATYSTNVRIYNNKMHGNAVAGIYVSCTKGIWVENNEVYENGVSDYPGTGYGIALGYSVDTMYTVFNSEAVISNNKAYHNKRKGIDVHRGRNIQIVNNQCWADTTDGIGDQIYQIAALSVQGSILIQGNQIATARDRTGAGYSSAYANEAI
jgi:parallel beta-helix repeat protein